MEMYSDKLQPQLYRGRLERFSAERRVKYNVSLSDP